MTTPTHNRKPWTPAEIKLLKQNAGTLRIAQFAELLGRTPDSVKAKANKLKICLRLRGEFHQRFKHPLSKVEAARQLHESKTPLREIASRLDLPMSTVKHYVYFDRRINEVV